jgi:ribonuclease E
LKSVSVSLHPELADAIQNTRRKELADLEREFDIHVEIIAATGLHRSEETIEWSERSVADAAAATTPAAVSAADLADGIRSKPKAAPPADPQPQSGQPSGSDEEKDKAKTPRKRRRGGRKRKKPDSDQTDSPEIDRKPDGNASESSSDGAPDDGGGSSKTTKKKRRGGRRRRKKPSGTGDGSDSNSEPPSDEPIAEINERDPFAY